MALVNRYFYLSICYPIFCLCLCILHRSIYHRNYKWTIIDNFFWWCFWRNIINSIFTVWNYITITHDICARRDKLRQGRNSVIPVEVAGILYQNDIKCYERKSKISPLQLMIWSVGRSNNAYVFMRYLKNDQIKWNLQDCFVIKWWTYDTIWSLQFVCYWYICSIVCYF